MRLLPAGSGGGQAPALTLAWATTGAILRQPFTLGLLLVLAAMIPVCACLTLFSLGAKAYLVRETGLANLWLGGLALVLLGGHYQPGPDVRSGAGLALLATPLTSLAHAAGRLAGLALALALLQGFWAGVLWGVLRWQGAGTVDRGMAAAVLLGWLALVVLAAALQRLSLWLSEGACVMAGLGLYLVAQLVGPLAASAEATAGAALGFCVRLLPDLGALNLATPAALGAPIGTEVLGWGLAHGLLAVAGLVGWTALGMGDLRPEC